MKCSLGNFSNGIWALRGAEGAFCKGVNSAMFSYFTTHLWALDAKHSCVQIYDSSEALYLKHVRFRSLLRWAQMWSEVRLWEAVIGQINCGLHFGRAYTRAQLCPLSHDSYCRSLIESISSSASLYCFILIAYLANCENIDNDFCARRLDTCWGARDLWGSSREVLRAT